MFQYFVKATFPQLINCHLYVGEKTSGTWVLSPFELDRMQTKKIQLINQHKI